jgi:hypothetical protein
MCNHPEERVQQCLQAERAKRPGAVLPPFVFCVNITVPGKTCYHLVMYYAVDDFSLIRPIERGENCASPFRELASRFFFGPSNEFRDSTFKLIPRIVKGNFLVKKAVGSKPTILGKRLKQHYIQNDRFFELIIDVGSNDIAKSVVGLSCGYVSFHHFSSFSCAVSVTIIIGLLYVQYGFSRIIFESYALIHHVNIGQDSSGRYGILIGGKE